MDTFKALIILLLVVFGSLEVSCRRQRKNVLMEGAAEPRSSNNRVTSTAAPATTTKDTFNLLADSTPNPSLPSKDDPLVPAKDARNGTYTHKKKFHVSSVGFSMFIFSGYSLSAQFITLMLLLTNKLFVSKKKIPALQEPAPIS